MKNRSLIQPIVFAVLLLLLPQIAFSSTFHVRLNGNDANSGSLTQPFRTLGRAIQQLQSGDTIQLGPGTFVESSTLNLSNLNNISILGSGRGLGSGATILTGNWTNTTTDVEQSATQPRLLVASDINGLTLRNLTFSGNNRAIARGMDMRRIDGLAVEEVDFMRFLSTALDMEAVSNGQLTDMNIHEAGYGWTGWSLGMLGINSLTDVLFDSISFYSPNNPPDKSYGYAVKSVGRANDPQWNVLRRVVFSNLNIHLHPGQAWNHGSAPNFSFEFIRASLVDVEIRDSQIRNSISLPDVRTVSGGTRPYGLTIHRNTFDFYGWAYWVELAGSSIEIAYNHVKHAYPVSGHAFLTDFSRGGKTFSDISVHHNVIENAVRFMRLESAFNNLRVYNNTAYLLLGSGPQQNPAFIAKQSTGGGGNWQINNNAVVSITGAAIPLLYKDSTTPHPTNLSVRNNRLDEVTLGAIPSGASVSGNSYGDPGFYESGAAPYPYFASLSASSAVVDEGVSMGAPYVGSAPDIGAFEWGGPTILGGDNNHVEAEDVSFSGSGGSVSTLSDSNASGGQWVMLGNGSAGSYLEGSINADAGTYDVSYSYKIHSSRGRVQLRVNGSPVGAVIDQSIGGSSSFVTVNLGLVTFTASGAQTFRFTLDDNSGAKISVDSITLTATEVKTEAEDVSFSGSGGSVSTLSDSNASGGQWVMLDNGSAGSYLEGSINADAGTYDVSYSYKIHSSRGRVQLSVNGSPVGAVVDQSVGSSTSFVTVNLGSVTFTASGAQTFRFTLDDNSGSKISVDSITMTASDGGSSEPELIMDNSDSGVQITGTWSASTWGGGGAYQGSNYLHDDNNGKGSKSVRFTPSLSNAVYAVYIKYTSTSSRASNVPVDVVHSGGTDYVSIDQRTGGGEWVLLGTYSFDAGTSGSVLIQNAGTSGHVVADAVRFLPQ